MHPRLQGAMIFVALLDPCLRLLGFAVFFRNFTLAAGIMFLLVALSLGYASVWAPDLAKRVFVFAAMGMLLFSLLSLGILQSRELARRNACTNHLRRAGITMLENQILDPQEPGWPRYRSHLRD